MKQKELDGRPRGREPRADFMRPTSVSCGCKLIVRVFKLSSAAALAKSKRRARRLKNARRRPEFTWARPRNESRDYSIYLRIKFAQTCRRAAGALACQPINLSSSAEGPSDWPAGWLAGQCGSGATSLTGDNKASGWANSGRGAATCGPHKHLSGRPQRIRAAKLCWPSGAPKRVGADRLICGSCFTRPGAQRAGCKLTLVS